MIAPIRPGELIGRRLLSRKESFEALSPAHGCQGLDGIYPTLPAPRHDPLPVLDLGANTPWAESSEKAELEKHGKIGERQEDIHYEHGRNQPSVDQSAPGPRARVRINAWRESARCAG